MKWPWRWSWRFFRGIRKRIHRHIVCPYCGRAFGLDVVPVVYDP